MCLFMFYLLKVSICLALFYLFYRILLAQETFYTLNRYLLLIMMPLSFILPLIQLKVQSPSEITQMVWTLEEVLIVPDGMPAGQKMAFSWEKILFAVYLLGVVSFWGKHLYAMISLYHFIRQGERLDDEQGNTLVIHQHKDAPFSWMHYIVMSRDDLEENGLPILLHEQAHIRYRHSWDLILSDCCISLLWWNPAAWLVKQELQNVHEYQADQSVINHGINAKSYQLLLIKKAVGTRLYSMTNSFNHSTLKKRITMMIKRKSNPWARMKHLYVLPLAAIAVTAFARPETSFTTNEIFQDKVSNFQSIHSIAKTENITDIKQKPEKVYDNKDVDEPAKYKDGYMELLKFLSKNLHYPEVAIKNKLEGRTLISFVINADGTMSDIKVKKSSHPVLDQAAIDVVKKIPQRWIPGQSKGQHVNVTFSLPIVFKIQ